MPLLTGDLVAGLNYTPGLSGASPLTIVAGMQDAVRPEMFGAVGNGSTDDTAAFTAARATGKTIRLADKTYLVDQITVRSEQSIIGDSPGGATIKKKSGSNTPPFVMPAGPVVRCAFGNFKVDGNGSSGDCWYIHAQASAGSPFHGGLWDSSFFNMTVSGFGGNSFWFRGGADGHMLPNQFIDFRNVYSERNEGTTARALLITGQTGQFTYTNTRFECGNNNTTQGGVNIEIGQEYQNGDIIGGPLIGGSMVGANRPYLHRFDLLTSQGGDRGMYINGSGIHINSSYFENLQRAIDVAGASIASVVGTRFANAGSDGASGGFCIRARNTSKLVDGYNVFAGTYDDDIITADTAVVASFGY